MLALTPIWTDIGSFAILTAQLVVLAVAAIVAYRQVREARRLREAQTRPVVVLDFDVEDVNIFFLTLSNLGTTLARNIRITITPPFESALDGQSERVAGLRMFAAEGIPTLAPGKEIRTLFDSAFLRTPELGLRDVYEARITYQDHALERDFDETVTLDLGIYWGLGKIDHTDIDDINKRLEELVRELKNWSASGGGLLMLSPADLEQRTAHWRARAEERRRQQEGEDP